MKIEAKKMHPFPAWDSSMLPVREKPARRFPSRRAVARILVACLAVGAIVMGFGTHDAHAAPTAPQDPPFVATNYNTSDQMAHMLYQAGFASFNFEHECGSDALIVSGEKFDGEAVSISTLINLNGEYIPATNDQGTGTVRVDGPNDSFNTPVETVSTVLPRNQNVRFEYMFTPYEYTDVSAYSVQVTGAEQEEGALVWSLAATTNACYAQNNIIYYHNSFE